DLKQFDFNEINGGPVFILTEGEGIVEEPLLKMEDIYDGLLIAVPTLFGYVKAKVVFRDDASLIWESDTTWGNLEYSKDERKCWTSSDSIKKSIKKLGMSSDDGKHRLPVIN